MAEKIEDRPFFNVFDGTEGRVESVYLDMNERKEAEILRAKAEGREPDFAEATLSGAVGTPVVPQERRVDNKYYSNPSTVVDGGRDVDPMQDLPVDLGDADTDVDLSQAAQVARERSAQDQALMDAVGSDGEPAVSGEVETGSVDGDVSFSQANPSGTPFNLTSNADASTTE